MKSRLRGIGKERHGKGAEMQMWMTAERSYQSRTVRLQKTAGQVCGSRVDEGGGQMPQRKVLRGPRLPTA